MAVTAAVAVGTAAVGAASASKQRKAAKRAGQAQQRGITAAQEQQQEQFETTRADFAPFREAGTRAQTELDALLGLSGTEAQDTAFAERRESPGQAFLRERQERALLRNQAAIGGLGGGNVRTALQEQAFGIASTRLDQDLGQLQQIANRGIGAVGSTANFGAQAAANIGNLAVSGGNVRANSILNQDAARQSGLASIAGAFTGTGSPFFKNVGVGT